MNELKQRFIRGEFAPDHKRRVLFRKYWKKFKNEREKVN